MDSGIRISVTALCAVVLLVVIKKDSREFSLPIIFVTGGCIVLCLLEEMANISETIQRYARIAQIEPWVVEPVVKVVGLSVITKLTSELCRGAGETGVASFVETAGTILAIFATLPLAQEVVDMVVEMLS